jgi:hypothetical protein
MIQVSHRAHENSRFAAALSNSVFDPAGKNMT